ncbi:hypothetical protein HPB52_022571 [Rhipicephalus sanguineus]|uniref:Uncharacterized protein n=1 Tax=Rhipicephalus sanguineus TaxID=34632 RepID=A0A9D4SQZ7_RHISA|nr:hypothetical protein HPB52_022571 [Rhipicephalus sanguineus]
MNHTRRCGFPDTGGHEQIWRLEEREVLAVPKTGTSVREPRSSMRVRSISGLFRPCSTTPGEDSTVLAVLTTPGRMNHVRRCGFLDTGGHEQIWRLEEREVLAVPKTGASVREPRSSMRVRSTSGLCRPCSTSD